MHPLYEREAPLSKLTVEELNSLGLKIETLPRHVAIVMDGNGRWAQQRGLPRSFGHRAGTERLREMSVVSPGPTSKNKRAKAMQGGFRFASSL